MFLDAIFQGYRRSEPIHLLCLRACTMILIIAVLSGYLAILAIDIANDNPVIKQTIVPVNFLPAPDLSLGMSYDFNLTCFAFLGDYTTSSDCINAITYDHDDELFYANFSNDGSFLMSPLGHEKGINFLHFQITIKDPNFNTSKPGVLVLIAYDAEANPNSDYQTSIYGMNSYNIDYDVHASLAYTRSIKEIIQPSRWIDFGIPPEHNKEYYINSNVVTGSLSKYDGFNDPLNFAIVSIQAKSLFVTVETEQRSKTVFSSFALFGGAWGLAAGIYTLCFGNSVQRPWGCAQTFCCIFSQKAKSQFRKTFPVIPLTGNAKFELSDDPESNLIPQSQDPAVQHLEQRFEALELFLRKYIIDVKFLDALDRVKDNFNNNNGNQPNSSRQQQTTPQPPQYYG
ncbi:10932_t:CDS:10 [Ambispora leptoticha]|uniref:10932_t:CDS:1 n=1 Tax=Ambispora leptoticha TaxID=144679 RepID=A0A9N9G6W2_9GLOM|nr:10932_t:CDS:10 [Ambispora leptoticha]